MPCGGVNWPLTTPLSKKEKKLSERGLFFKFFILRITYYKTKLSFVFKVSSFRNMPQSAQWTLGWEQSMML